MEYIGNRPPGGPTSNPPPDRWWLQDWTGGSGRDYQDQSFEEAYREFLRQQQQPQQPNEGQVVNQPQDPTGTAQDPVFSTDVWGNNQPLQTIGTNNQNYDLNEYLASLPGGQGGGTGGGGYQFPGAYGDPFTFDPNLPPSTFAAEGTTKVHDFPGAYPVEEWQPNLPVGGVTFDAEGTYKPPPDIVGWPEFKFEPNPPPGTKIPPVGPTIKVPPDPTKPPPPDWEWPPIPQPKTQQPQQQNPIGQVLAALPMLAAFQGGTTTTPAPYAHLGPHTPVAPVFKPQGRGNPIPSIGQLLAGVR